MKYYSGKSVPFFCLIQNLSLIVYDIPQGTVTFQSKWDHTLGTAFHIWIN